MFDLDSNKYASYAKEAIEIVESGNLTPDEAIGKIIEKYNLNPNQGQRVVEEYNINMFLNKLKEGTQHENFLLANPVVDECERIIKIPYSQPQKPESGSQMSKTASYDDSVYIPYSSFEYGNDLGVFDEVQVEGEFLDESPFLTKVALDKSYKREQVELEELVKEASYRANQYENNIFDSLVKVANISPGVAKNVVYDLVKMGAEEIAEEVVNKCKFKPQEIIDASIGDEFLNQTELNKVAGVKDIFKALSGIKAIKKTIKETKDSKLLKSLIKHLKENPGHIAPVLIAIKSIKEISKDDKPQRVSQEIAASFN